MPTQKSICGMMSALLAAAVVMQAKPGAAAEPCVFDVYDVSAVQPYQGEENVGYGSYTRLRGAQMFVPARPGLTAEWLTVTVRRSLARPPSTLAERACKPVVPARVQVVPGEEGFWILLDATDERSAAALLRWARRVAPVQP